MMNALQINQNVEEESALKVCAEDGEEDNFIFTQSYVLIQKPATMMVIALKKNPYVEIEIAEVCYVIYQSWEKDNVFVGDISTFYVTFTQDASQMMNVLQVNQNVEEESALKVCYK